MADRVIHISEAEAARDFAALMARVRAGEEIVIESGDLPVAVIHALDSATPLHLGVHRYGCQKIQPPSWMQISPATSRRRSRAIVSLSNRPHGIDPGFERSDRGRAARPERAADAWLHRGSRWRNRRCDLGRELARTSLTVPPVRIPSNASVSDRSSFRNCSSSSGLPDHRFGRSTNRAN